MTGRPAAPDSAALVLAGGASRRMGRPKPFLRVGGRELLERALDAAASACSTVLLAAGDVEPCLQAARRYGWKPAPGPASSSGATAVTSLLRRSTRLLVLPDRRSGEGPLAGLEAALLDGPTEVFHWWVVASDLPFAPSTLGQRLLAELGRREGDARAGAVVSAIDGRLQPLCAAYRRDALALASSCLEEGVRSMSAFLERLEIRTVDLAGDERQWLLNVNTEEQLARANALADDRERRRDRGKAP